MLPHARQGGFRGGHVSHRGHQPGPGGVCPEEHHFRGVQRGRDHPPDGHAAGHVARGEGVFVPADPGRLLLRQEDPAVQGDPGDLHERPPPPDDPDAERPVRDGSAAGSADAGGLRVRAAGERAPEPGAAVQAVFRVLQQLRGLRQDDGQLHGELRVHGVRQQDLEGQLDLGERVLVQGGAGPAALQGGEAVHVEYAPQVLQAGQVQAADVQDRQGHGGGGGEGKNEQRHHLRGQTRRERQGHLERSRFWLFDSEDLYKLVCFPFSV